MGILEESNALKLNANTEIDSFLSSSGQIAKDFQVLMYVYIYIYV